MIEDGAVTTLEGRIGFVFNGRFVPVFAGGSDDGSGTPEGGGSGTPDQSSSQEGDSNAGDSDDSGSTDSSDARILKAELERARKEAAQYRKRGQAAGSELEKAQARIQELEEERSSLVKEREERLLRLTVATHARNLNFADPDDALALLDRSDLLEDGEIDEGEVKKRLRKLVEAKPYLTAGTKRTSNGAPGSAGSTKDDGSISPGYGRLVSAYGKD